MKNAAWVYESQLYHQPGEEVVVDPEVLGILHNIVCGDDGNNSL